MADAFFAFLVFLFPTVVCSAVAGLFAVAGPGGYAAWRFFLGGAVAGGILGLVLALAWLRCQYEEDTEATRG